MSDYAQKTGQINEAFERYRCNPKEEREKLCELLYPYLRGIVGTLIKEKNYIDEEAVEDLVQDIMYALFDKVLDSFKGNAKFSTFCFAIAKNKVNSYITKRNKARIENIDDIYELEVEGELARTPADIYKDPQLLYIIQETRLEMLGMFKNYIDIIMNSAEKPYRVVSVCFSQILFHKHKVQTKKLGSPEWAYTCLKGMSVDEGAETFKTEINQWLKNVHFDWGVKQMLLRRGEENGIIVGKIIFGHKFTPKDFENWSSRMKKDIKRMLIEKEGRYHETGTSFELGL